MPNSHYADAERYILEQYLHDAGTPWLASAVMHDSYKWKYTPSWAEGLPVRKEKVMYERGTYLKITGNTNDHRFKIGEIVKVRDTANMGIADWATIRCEHLDGRDWWNVRPSDCVPANMNSIKFKKKRGAV